MKKFILSILTLLLIISCNEKKTFKDINEYNKAIVSSFYKVQLLNDSLERELLTIKYQLELSPTQQYNYKKYTDSTKLNDLFNSCLISTAEARKNINKIYFETDSFFKPAILKAIDIIEENLTYNFKPLCDSILTMNNKVNIEVLNAILPLGKASYNQYQAAFDTIYQGQMILNSKNNYFINSDLTIRFAF